MREWLVEHASNDLPVVMLLVLMLLSVWMLLCASRAPDGTIGKMLQDDQGKPSIARLCYLWGFNVTAWAVMKDTLRPNGIDWRTLVIFVGGTFGAAVIMKIVEKWDGHLPWAKGAE